MLMHDIAFPTMAGVAKEKILLQRHVLAQAPIASMPFWRCSNAQAAAKSASKCGALLRIGSLGFKLRTPGILICCLCQIQLQSTVWRHADAESCDCAE